MAHETQDLIDDLNNVPLTCTLQFTRTWQMTVTAKNASHAEAILQKLVDEQNANSPPEPTTVGSIITIKPEW